MDRLRNEYWAHELETDLRPRLFVPRAIGWILRPLGRILAEPFELAELSKRPPGKLLDVGCGNGRMLRDIQHMGWDGVGIEFDPVAVQSARARGLVVIEGSYTRAREFHEAFDAIVCSHVLEHVHEPLDLVATLARALKPGGVLLLSSPNATSIVRQHFGNDWRGLEAPRHLTIPAARQLKRNLSDVGLTTRQRRVPRLWTAAESSRIRRRDTEISAEDIAAARSVSARVTIATDADYDFIEFACVKDKGRVD